MRGAQRQPTMAPNAIAIVVFPLTKGSASPANCWAHEGMNAVAQAHVPINATDARTIPNRTRRSSRVLKISRSGSADARRADSCHRFDSGRKAKMNKARRAGVEQVA